MRSRSARGVSGGAVGRVRKRFSPGAPWHAGDTTRRRKKPRTHLQVHLGAKRCGIGRDRYPTHINGRGHVESRDGDCRGERKRNGGVDWRASRHRATLGEFSTSRTSRVSSRIVGGSFPGQRRTAIRAPRTPRPAPAQARSARVLSPRSARPRDQRAGRGRCARRELSSTSGIVESPPLARPVARRSPCRAWTPS